MRDTGRMTMDSMKMELPAFGERVFQADYIQKKRHRRVSYFKFIFNIFLFNLKTGVLAVSRSGFWHSATNVYISYNYNSLTSSCHCCR